MWIYVRSVNPAETTWALGMVSTLLGFSILFYIGGGLSYLSNAPRPIAEVKLSVECSCKSLNTPPHTHTPTCRTLGMVPDYRT